MSVDPGRTEAIRDSPSTQDVKEIARFIGIVNFFHKYIPRFAERAGPLNLLHNKGYNRTACPSTQFII